MTGEINKLERKVEELEAERDALAASLQDIRIAASFAAPGFAKEIERRTLDPTTSLAHLKAQWQAEALEDYADDMTIEQNQHTARARALKIWRQAV